MTSAREVGISAYQASADEVPLFPMVAPPAIVELSERDKQLVKVMRELSANSFAGPFRVAEVDEQDIERYSDRFRTKFSRQALLESWLPADAREYFPQELLRAARSGTLASKEEIARAAKAAAGRANQPMSAKALAAWQKKEERLRRKAKEREQGGGGAGDDDDEEEEGEGEGEEEEGEGMEEEELEDFNDYGVDYYDSGMDDDDGGDDGAVF